VKIFLKALFFFKVMGNKIRVAHLISTSGLYGAERWILALLNNLKDIQSEIICLSNDDMSLIEQAKKDNIKTKVLSVNGNFSIFNTAKKLSRYIKKEKIDIIHTHGYKSDLIGYIASKKSKIKIISTPHGWSHDAGFKLKTYEFLDRIILGFFDMVCPLSDELTKTLDYVPDKYIKQINNFIDLNNLPKIKKGDKKLITYTGQLIERKRIQDIIYSLKYLDKSIKLQIIGDGSELNELKLLVNKLALKQRVFFLGFRKDRLVLLDKSEIFILPSLKEGIPRAMMEAMAMERVVIGTDIPGIRDLIKHNETGLLVPVKSPKRIASAINHLIKDYKLTNKLKKKAKKLIEDKFSAKRAAKEYKELYIKLIK
jgi:glycosyltransferase involved in cell wall biosynthesis